MKWCTSPTSQVQSRRPMDRLERIHTTSAQGRRQTPWGVPWIHAVPLPPARTSRRSQDGARPERVSNLHGERPLSDWPAGCGIPCRRPYGPANQNVQYAALIFRCQGMGVPRLNLPSSRARVLHRAIATVCSGSAEPCSAALSRQEKRRPKRPAFGCVCGNSALAVQAARQQAWYFAGRSTLVRSP